MVKGKAWKFGDNVDTDLIIPARYLNTSEPGELARHCLEGADPGFPGKVRRGDVVIAGKNFGSGSSREHAPIALKAAGVSCVVARSFARIFYRNSFNMGLPILECPEAVDGIDGGHAVEIDFESGTIRDATSGTTFQARPIPEFMRELVRAGGLLKYVAGRPARSGRPGARSRMERA